MNAPHPDPSELRAWRERRLPVAAMLRLDRHLAGCEHCRDAMSQGAAPATRRVLAQVLRKGAHLSWEQLEGHVDGRLDSAARAFIDRHVAACAVCRHELEQLVAAAPGLRRSVAPAAQRGWIGRLFGQRSSAWVPALASVAMIGAVIATVMLSPSRDGGPPSISMQASAPGRAAVATLDHSALDQLDRLSPDAVADWRARDATRLAALLQPLADQGQPLAMSALASLYAQGLGVPKDLRMAEQLWQRAGERGDERARANAELLKRR